MKLQKNFFNRFFPCNNITVTVALNHEEIGKNPERITKIKSFINKYNWEGINYPTKKIIGKNLRKIIQRLLLMFCMLEKIKMYPDKTQHKL